MVLAMVNFTLCKFYSEKRDSDEGPSSGILTLSGALSWWWGRGWGVGPCAESRPPGPRGWGQVPLAPGCPGLAVAGFAYLGFGTGF